MRHRLLLLIVLLAGSLAGADGEAKPQIALDEGERAWLAGHPAITIALDDANPPLNFRQPDGGYAGLSVDYLRLITAKAGLRLDLAGWSWNEALGRAMRHEVDGIMSASFKEERRAALDFTQAYCETPEAMVTRQDFPAVDGLAGLAGKRIAVVSGSVRVGLLHEQVPDVIVVEVKQAGDGLCALAEGRVDACFDDLPVVQQLIDQMMIGRVRVALLYFQPEAVAQRIGVRNDAPALRSMLDKAIAAITPEEHALIRDRWLRLASGAAVQRDLGLSGEERAWLAAHPVVRVAIDPDWAPIEWRDASGVWRGISADYLEHLHQLLGVRFEVDPARSWQEARQHAEEGRIDLFSSLVETVERRDRWLFTESYASFPIAIFARNEIGYLHGLDALAGCRVAVVKGYAEEEMLRRDCPRLTLVAVPSTGEGMRLVRRGEVSAYVGGLLPAAYFLQEAGDISIHVVGETPYAYHPALAVRHDWPELHAILGKALRAIPQEQRDSLRRKWVSLSVQRGSDYSLLWKLGGPVLLLLVVFLLWNRRLQAEIRRRVLVEGELVASRDRLARHGRDLEAIKNEAESANRAKSVFLANMSHEIRTPLNAVLGYAQLLGRSPTLAEDHRKAVTVINRSGEHLLQLINDVLEMSRIEAGRITSDPGDFDLPALLDNLHSLFLLRAQDKGIALAFVLADGLPRHIRSDQRKIRQILLNLLSNAVKFTDRGEVRLSASLRAGRLVVAVGDSGPGMTPEEQQGLFQPFFQAGENRRKGEGTGLGLAISLGFARLLEGSLTVRSAPGRGSEFTLEIPVEVVDSAPVERPLRQLVGLAPGQAVPRLLVAEDHADSRQLLVDVLRRGGCRVEAVSDGAAAVAACRRERPDLIWMDIDMPVMDGLAAAAAIRALPGPPPRIVALTAAAFAEDRARILAGGCDEVAHKPFVEAELFHILERLLQVRFLWSESPAAGASEPPSLPEATVRQALLSIPAEERARLAEAVVTGDLDACHRLLASWPDRALAEALAGLLSGFAFERVGELLAPPGPAGAEPPHSVG